MNKNRQKVLETEFHVRYAETDAMGVVHHATYLIYFEEGRSQYMRDHGFEFSAIEKEGFRFPVTEVSVRYVVSFRYGDKVKIQTKIEENRSRSVKFAYDVLNPDTGERLVSGFTKHIWTGSEGNVTRMPQKWLELSL
jgi:acyl-CoA thioester hydrolase